MSSKSVRSLMVLAALSTLGLSACNNPSSMPSGDASTCPSVGGTWTATPGMTGMMACAMVTTVMVEQTGCSVRLGLDAGSTTGTFFSDGGPLAASGAWSAPLTVPGLGSEAGTIGRAVGNLTTGTLEYRTGSPEATVCTWTLTH